MSNTATLDFTPVSVTLANASLWVADRVNEKIDAVNVRLAKLGAPLASVEFGPVVDCETTDIYGFKGIERRFEFVTVTGFEAKFSGWTPVATLDFTLVEDEALVAKFPGKDEVVVPESFRFEGPVCDHCHVLRNRNTTVAFVNEAGEWVRVGTSCILDFIGIDPANVLWIVGVTDEIKESAFEGAGERLQGPDPILFLAYASEVTREFGFIPSQCEWTQTSTKSNTWTALNPPKNVTLRDILPQFDADRANESAAAIMRWVNAQPATTEFIQSAQLAIRADVVSRRTDGILASLPHVVRKATERDEAKAAEQALRPSEFIGKVGDKIQVTGTVIVARQIHTDFGTSMLIAIRTDEGDRVSTFGSGSTLFGTEEGDRVVAKGTIKEHKDDERYGKETKLTRVKLADA